MTRPTILDLDLVVVPQAMTPEMIAAAWAAWHSRHGGKIGPGPAFGEAVPAAISASPYPTAWDDVRKYVEGLEAGIKRLSDEEELCDETTGDDPFSIVRLAAKLAACEARSRKIMSSLSNVVLIGDVGHYVNDAVFDALTERANRAEAAEARIAELEKRLADAERVVEPFADGRAKITHANGCRYHGGHDCDCGKDDYLRAARAYMEGKEE